MGSDELLDVAYNSEASRNTQISDLGNCVDAMALTEMRRRVGASRLLVLLR